MSLTDKHCMNQTRRLRGPPHQRGSREAPDAMANHNTIHPASYTHLDIRCRMNGYSTERDASVTLPLQSAARGWRNRSDTAVYAHRAGPNHWTLGKLR